jgi:undecaprenyl-diphosphatase
MAFPESLQKLDAYWLYLVNRRWSNPVFDTAVPWLRYQEVWYPFYIFLIAFALINFGKRGAWWIAGFIATIGLSDTVSSRLIKLSVERLRPCNNVDVLQFLQLRVTHCSGGYSFTSSHAANHFAMATFIALTLQPIVGKKIKWVYVWAASIGFAQVYVGVHYPIDVICGSLVGIVIGWMTGNYFNKKIGLKGLGTHA